MSANDILDVLNIQKDATPQPLKKKIKLDTHKKQSGMNRELYNLLGANTPPIQMAPTSRFKDRLGASTKPTPWSRAKFRNNSRTDGLELSHWIKGSSELGKDVPYSFEKFNVKLDVPSLTEEAYEAYVEQIGAKSKEIIKKEQELELEEDEVSDPLEPWSYAEVQYLFDLCFTYDLRWFVIQDRYEFPGNDNKETRRSVEDLKAEYYKITALLYEKDESPPLQLINNLNSFDKQKEIDRKKYLERLLARSPAEIAEEESLVVEARRFEMAAKKMLTERTQLLQLLDSPQGGSVQQYLNSQGLTSLYNTLMTSEKQRKRKNETPVPPVIPPAASSSIKREKGFQSQLQAYLQAQVKISGDTTSPIAQLLAKRLSPKEEEAFGLSYNSEKVVAGAALRTTKLLTFKPTVQVKVASMLTELELPAKPVMPTAKTCAKYDELTKAINLLLDFKRQCDKLEAENAVIKEQKQL